MKLKIRIYGEGYIIHKLDLPKKILKEIKKHKDNLPYVLTKVIPPTSNITSIYDYCVDHFIAISTEKNTQFEIWLGRKKIAKIPAKSISNQNTLFPIYKIKTITTIDNFKEPQLYLKENVIGCLGIFEKEVNEFDINLLSFLILKNSSFSKPVIIHFNYQKELFSKISDDCLIRQQEIIKFL